MTESHLAVSPNVEKGKFEVCEKRGEEYFVRFNGDLEGFADCLFGWGIAARFVREGKDSYIVLNSEDYERFTEGPDYDC
jgi:hypothetical protein